MAMQPFDGEGEAVHIRTEPQREVDAAHRSGRRWWPASICCGLYVILAILEFGVTKSLGSGQTTGPGTPDQVQQIWFLEWARYALAHGHNPFLHTVAELSGGTESARKHFHDGARRPFLTHHVAVWPHRDLECSDAVGSWRCQLLRCAWCYAGGPHGGRQHS